MSERSWGFRTRAVHAGAVPDATGAKTPGISWMPVPPQPGQVRWAAASISKSARAAAISSSRAPAGTTGSSSVSWCRLVASKSRSRATDVSWPCAA